MRIVNLTEHRISFYDQQTELMVFEPSVTPLRMNNGVSTVESIDGYKFYCKSIGKLNYEVPKIDDTLYIVSSTIKSSYPREDFITITDPVKNKIGTVVGCKAFTITRGGE